MRDIPFDWLFPRVRAVVHHGGSGTTHSALRCGRKQLIIPHLADQLLGFGFLANLQRDVHGRPWSISYALGIKLDGPGVIGQILWKVLFTVTTTVKEGLPS